MLKKTIRGILKIPLTFIVIPFYLLLLLASYGTSAWFWLYDGNEWDVRANRDARKDLFVDMKEWFTTI